MRTRDPVLHRGAPAHYANLMIKYMVARKLQQANPSLRLSNFDMPYWNIACPEIPAEPDDRVVTLPDEQHVDFARIKRAIDRDEADRFDWLGYGQRLEYFPDKQTCRAMFERPDEPGLSFGDDCIVCPVRAGEILGAIHPGYTVVPVEFYADIVEETGLRPVFTGQTEPNLYLDALRARFPKAEFVPHQGVVGDFQTIRNARHIALSVSTFAWLAAWLSRADTIVFPIFGMFDPRLFASHALVPFGEPNYRFYKFPPQPAVPLSELLGAHAAIRGQWSACDAATFP